MIRMSEGQELVGRVVQDLKAHGLEPDARESELLSIAEALADRAEQLEQCIAQDGLSLTLKSGRVIVNPLVAEARMTRTSLATVLGRVSMVEGVAKDPQRVAAAQKRWLQHNLAKARGSG
jgi:hypothetical protein